MTKAQGAPEPVYIFKKTYNWDGPYVYKDEIYFDDDHDEDLREWVQQEIVSPLIQYYKNEILDETLDVEESWVDQIGWELGIELKQKIRSLCDEAGKKFIQYGSDLAH